VVCGWQVIQRVSLCRIQYRVQIRLFRRPFRTNPCVCQVLRPLTEILW
jgi:hypothetical protein